MYTAVIFAVLAVAVLGDPHPPPPASPPSDIDPECRVSCDYFTKTENCRWKHMKKYDSEYHFAKDTHQKHWMMKDKPEECDDGDRWDINCPCDSHELTDHCDDLMVDMDTELKYCRKSCLKCGEGAFLTVLKEYEEEDTEYCCEYSHAWPYKCMKMEKTKTLMPAMLMTPVDFDKCDEVSASNPAHLCISFLFRRRACVDPPPKELTTFRICEESQASKFNEDDKAVCEQGSEIVAYTDQMSTHFNAWKKFVYQREPIDTQAECMNYRRIIFAFEKGSDFFDIDQIKLSQDHCKDENDMDLAHGTSAVYDYME